VANVDRHLGRLLPDGFTEDDFRNVQHFSNWYFMIEAGGQNTLISNVMKFGKVFREFDNRIKDIKNYPLKWTFISGHDFDLMAMHMAMKTSSP
jgi:hypothetical protein